MRKHILKKKKKKNSWAFGMAKDSSFQISGNYQIALILIELN